MKNRPSQMADLSAPELRGISNLDTAFQTRLDYATVDGRELTVKKIGKGTAVIVGVIPLMLNPEEFFRLRSSFRRRTFLVSQILRNAGIASGSALLERFSSQPVKDPWLAAIICRIRSPEMTRTVIIIGKLTKSTYHIRTCPI